MLLKLAFRNLGRGWRRSAITMAAVALGLTLAILMIGWTRGMMFQLSDNAIHIQLAHLALQRPGYQQNPDVQRNLGQDGGLLLDQVRGPGRNASARLRGEGVIQSARRGLRVAVIGVDPADEATVSVVPGAVVEGSFLAGSPDPRPRALPPVVIGRGLAERLRVGLGDKVVIQVPGEGGLGAFRVRGVYRTNSSEFDRSAAYLRFEAARRLFAVEGPTEIAVTLDRPAGIREVHAELVSQLEALPGVAEVAVLRWDEREPRIAAMLDLAGSIYWMLYSILFVAMAFGIANSMLMAVYERIREFGVLRSLGLSAKRLVALVVVESVVLTLAGTALGLLIGLPIVWWLGRVGIDLSVYSSALEGYGIGSTIYLKAGIEDVVIPVGVALITAVVAAIWPALKAARLRPAEALRAV
jgi:ABC-type lipoprotein release transport system permease subunit